MLEWSAKQIEDNFECHAFPYQAVTRVSTLLLIIPFCSSLFSNPVSYNFIIKKISMTYIAPLKEKAETYFINLAIVGRVQRHGYLKDFSATTVEKEGFTSIAP